MSLPTVLHNGVERVLAALPPRGYNCLPEWRDRYGAPGIAQNYRLDFDVPILDQGQSPACGGHAAASAAMLAHAFRTGGEIIRLSPWWLWALCNGGDPRSGVVISDVLEALKAAGCSPDDDFPHGAYRPNQGGQAAAKAAFRFRAEEAYNLRSAQEIVSAIILDKPCVMGVQLGNNFDQVDGDGVSPPPDVIRGGHALCVDEVFVSSRWGVCLGGPNSWGPTFGRDGRYRVPAGVYLSQGTNAFAIEALVPDPQSDGPIAA